MVRWGVRLFRREWHRQLLVLILLGIAVAGSAFSMSATYNLAPSSDATFGRADQLLRFDGSDPARLQARIAAAGKWFGTIERIGHRYAAVPGLFDPVDIRAQDPRGPYGAPMLALREGRYPSGTAEIAITDVVARTLRAGIGTRIALDGRTRAVVGLVENPSDLTDEFAVVDPAHPDAAQTVTVLVAGDRANLDAFRATLDGSVVRESRPASTRTLTAVITLALAAIGLLLVSLVAGAGFVVLAQRRLRQLGMLAAIGATQRQLRLVMLANGALVGAIAAVVGTVAGVVLWLLLAARVEASVGHRIGRFDLPWALLGAGMLLAVATATVAAWWPARAIARTPPVSALSARPPRPRPARRSALVAATLLAGGVGSLALSRDANPFLIIAGAVATALGMLLVSPSAIRTLTLGRARMPVAVRLAVTDLTRYRARSSAALAAISLGLGISVAIVAGSAAAEYTGRRDAGLGNLANTHLLLRIGLPQPVIPERTPVEVARLDAEAAAIAAALDAATVIPLDMAMVTSYSEPGAQGGPVGHPAVELGQPTGVEDVVRSYPLHVATPDLLGLYGLDAGSIAADVDVLSVHTGPLELSNIPERELHPKVQTIPNLGYSSAPNSLITPAALRRHGWQAARVGWFIQAGRPPTPQQLATVQSLAVDAGLTVESRREQPSLANLRTGATAAGLLLALGVLASTVGLIRGESANDLRTLTATGAPRRVRRALTAATAGALAVLGAVLGTAGAYLALIGALHRDLAALGDVPLLNLAATIAGLPLLAAAAGWLLAGREPASIARRVLE